MTATIVPRMPIPPSNYQSGRNGLPISGIILHTMVTTLTGADATFHDPARIASAHYGVGWDGQTIYQWVKDQDTAYHCGRLDADATHPLANRTTLGIEHDDQGRAFDPRPDALYAASAQLVAAKCRLYGIPIDRTHIRKHSEVSINPTGCPDALNVDRIVNMAGGFMMNSDPCVVTWQGVLHLFYRAGDNSLAHKYFDTTANAWSAVENLGGSATGTPSATGDANDLHVFVRGADGNAWYRYFHLASSTWSAWTPV